MFTRTLLAIAVLGSALLGQNTVHVPDNSAASGTGSSIPFGSYGFWRFAPNQKYQTIVSWQSLAGLTQPFIEELGFASSHSGVHHFGSITIKLDQVSATKLSPTFAANLTANAVTVLHANDYYWHHTADSWSWLGLQQRFPLTPGKNLVIDIEIRDGVFLAPDFGPESTNTGSFRTSEKMTRLYAVNWKTTPPATGYLSSIGSKLALSSQLSALGLFGIGCKGTGKVSPSLVLSGSARPTGQVDVGLKLGLANNPSLLVIGFDNRTPFPVPVPGFPDCKLYQPVNIALATATDSAGQATVGLPLPASTSLTGVRLYTQFFQIEISNAGIGLRASNYGRILIGK